LCLSSHESCDISGLWRLRQGLDRTVSSGAAVGGTRYWETIPAPAEDAVLNVTHLDDGIREPDARDNQSNEDHRSDRVSNHATVVIIAGVITGAMHVFVDVINRGGWRGRERGSAAKRRNPTGLEAQNEACAHRLVGLHGWLRLGGLHCSLT
jgi:hypothetical protein